jgi:hypothetical protein
MNHPGGTTVTVSIQKYCILNVFTRPPKGVRCARLTATGAPAGRDELGLLGLTRGVEPDGPGELSRLALLSADPRRGGETGPFARSAGGGT